MSLILISKKVVAFELLCLLFSVPSFAQHNVRDKLLMDFGWRFAFGHPYDVKQDFNHGTSYFSYLAKAGYGDGPAAANFDDRSWRKLDLPHDWAVEQPFSANASLSHGFKAIGRNFPNASVGWYRKTFTIPASDLGRRIAIAFDGVYRNAKVFVNGHYLGTEASGYNSFQYDVTDLLNYGGNNVVAVRVDATMEEGWYYEGAGIYRHAWLVKTNPVHVVKDGTFVTSTVSGNHATVTAKAEVANHSKEIMQVSIRQTIVDATGNIIATANESTATIPPFAVHEYTSTLQVNNPHLWDINAPYLYKLVSTVLERNTVVDECETTFGIRTIRFDAKEGFFLNGRHVKLKGTNNHQDHAGVGTAMPDALQYWRIRALKEIGCNAYRTSHHPPTPELLEACDRLGMLVINENRLMRVTEDGLNDFKKLIRRDRNHPSVISWSVGNEEWQIENNITGERIANTLQAFAKSLDSTRTTTAGISGGFRSGIADVLEVMGYNYMGNGDIEAHHNRLPNQPSMGTEEGSTFSTRGIYFTDDAKHYQSAYDRKPRPSWYSIQESWKFYAERSWLAGIFYWTGFDYRGEPTPYQWPSVTSYFGLMDLGGFPKDNVFYLKSWWQDEPVLHILPHWTWPGKEGQEIAVWAYSNCDEVELFLNNKSQGRKKMKRNGHIEWMVKYQAGTLRAVGYKAGKRMMTTEVSTAGEPAAVALQADKNYIKADREDIAMVTVKVNDKNKLAVPVTGNEISFSITGPAKIIGVGNGDPTSHEPDKYIETIETVAIEGMKELQVANMHVHNELSDDYDDTKWKPAFTSRTHLDSAKAYVYRAAFKLPQNFKGKEITFFYKSLGTEQTIYINGKLVAESIKAESVGNAFKLDPSMLRAGRNTIAIVAEPIRMQHQWDNINTSAGTIQLLTPAAQWKRKLFNGLVQVIIQSTGEAGDITLTATSPGLAPAVLNISANPAVPRAAVNE